MNYENNEKRTSKIGLIAGIVLLIIGIGMTIGTFFFFGPFLGFMYLIPGNILLFNSILCKMKKSIRILLDILLTIVVCVIVVFISISIWTKDDNNVSDEQTKEKLSLEYLNNTYSKQSDTFTFVSCGYDLVPGSNDKCFFESEKYNDEITVYLSKVDNEYHFADNYFKLYMKEDAENYFNNIVKQYVNAETKLRFSTAKFSNQELDFDDYISSGECSVDVYFISNKEVDSDDINSILNNIANDKIYGSFNFITTNDTTLLADYTLDEILNNQIELFVSKEVYDINYEFKIAKSN